MSWDADYYVQTLSGPDIVVGSWNYTHNTNEMIEAAMGLEPTGLSVAERILLRKGREPWWRQLEQADASDVFLERIVDALAADPERFRAMNPANGWGSYDRLLSVLTEMRDASAKHPIGHWEVWG